MKKLMQSDWKPKTCEGLSVKKKEMPALSGFITGESTAKNRQKSGVLFTVHMTCYMLVTFLWLI